MDISNIMSDDDLETNGRLTDWIRRKNRVHDASDTDDEVDLVTPKLYEDERIMRKLSLEDKRKSNPRSVYVGWRTQCRVSNAIIREIETTSTKVRKFIIEVNSPDVQDKEYEDYLRSQNATGTPMLHKVKKAKQFMEYNSQYIQYKLGISNISKWEISKEGVHFEYTCAEFTNDVTIKDVDNKLQMDIISVKWMQCAMCQGSMKCVFDI
jgi:hypothetical protein